MAPPCGPIPSGIPEARVGLTEIITHPIVSDYVFDTFKSRASRVGRRLAFSLDTSKNVYLKTSASPSSPGPVASVGTIVSPTRWRPTSPSQCIPSHMVPHAHPSRDRRASFVQRPTSVGFQGRVDGVYGRPVAALEPFAKLGAYLRRVGSCGWGLAPARRNGQMGGVAMFPRAFRSALPLKG